MTMPARTSSGAQAGRLLLAAGAFTLVNNYLPGSEFLDVAVLNTIGLAAVALGLVSLWLPWHRLPVQAALVLGLAAFALISLGNQFGGVSNFSYSVYYVVVFVWVGISQPRRTSYWLAPFAAVAYVLPFLDDNPAPTNAVASVTVAIPVCILVGEVLAAQVRRLNTSREQLSERLTALERLAATGADLGRDLDRAAVLQRLADAAVHVLDGRGAFFGAIEGTEVVISAVAGLPQELVGARLPLVGSWLEEAAHSDRGVHVAGGDLAVDGAPAARASLTAACRAPHLVGGLTVLLGRAPELVSTGDEDVLRLLGAQGAAALLNAVKHEEALRQREHEQQVVDVLTDGVLVLDADDRTLACNTAAAALLGRAPAELIGKRAPLQLAGLGEPLEQELAPHRWVEATVTSLPATGERVVSLHDTSRQRALDEAKDLFLATSSHELRTPLTAIKGYVTLLTRRWDDLAEPARKEALATVDRQTDALIGLTEHLLMGARAGVQVHTPDPEPFDIGEVVRTAATTYAHISERHTVVASVPDTLPCAHGQPAGTANILGQLIENAIKYSPAGGPIELSVAAQDSLLEVEVADRGVGVPPGREASIFTPFYQGGSANTREYGGVGLGLYIVRQLVQAQGGTVSAANRTGGGAVMRFTVPVHDAA